MYVSKMYVSKMVSKMYVSKMVSKSMKVFICIYFVSICIYYLSVYILKIKKKKKQLVQIELVSLY